MNEGWLLIAQFLRPSDLCHMMQLSKNHFHLWVVDRMRMHQRKRMCAKFPLIAPVFDVFVDNLTEHTSKRAKASNSKKRKTSWITPKKGIWYFFKRWLSRGFTRSGFFQLYTNVQMHPIAASIILMHMPYSSRVVHFFMDRFNEDNYFSLSLKQQNRLNKSATIQLVFPKVLVVFTIFRKCGYSYSIRNRYYPSECIEKGYIYNTDIFSVFRLWRDFVLYNQLSKEEVVVPFWKEKKRAMETVL